MEPVNSAPKVRIRVAARARETPKSASRSRWVRSGRSSASSCARASGEGEEPPGSSGHRTDLATRGGRGGWEEAAATWLPLCEETIVLNASAAASWLSDT